MPDLDAIRARADLKQIEASIRRLHYYGDPPDARLQQDVDGDVLDIMDRILAALAKAEEENDAVEASFQRIYREQEEKLKEAQLRILGMEFELEFWRETYTDERGEVWTRPTGEAFAKVCKAMWADKARADAAEQERDKNAILAATLLAEMGRVRDPRMSDVATTLADLGRIVSGPDSIGVYPKASTLTAEQATQMLGEYRAALARAASGGTATRTGDPRPDGSGGP